DLQCLAYEFFFSSRRQHTRSVSAFLLNRSSDLRKPTALRLVNAEAVKILIFAAEGLTKRSAVGFLLRSLIMFQTFISRHNSNFRSEERRVGKECRSMCVCCD